MKTPSVRRNAKVLAAVAVSAGTMIAAGTAALPAIAAPAPARTHSATQPTRSFTVQRIVYGDSLHHVFQPNGTGAPATESLSSPDDITQLGSDFYVTFQNGVGPQGQASPDGDLDSTIVEFTLAGQEVRQWDLVGKCDGLTADPLTGEVIATVNEDANSSVYTIAPRTGVVTHYAYNEPLPHMGGTDAIEIYHGLVLISASAPGTTGGTAPSASFPAVYVVNFNAKTRIATVHPLFYDEATALAANGPDAGQAVQLALTDPDSNEVVPRVASAYGGDFMLDSQGDQELIFDHFTGHHQSLTVLELPRSVDDSAWVTNPSGAIYTTDPTDDTVDVITGGFTLGQMFSAVTPCDQNDAPATCPAPGFPLNYLATDNMRTGALTPVRPHGPALHPQGMIFIR